MPTFEITTESKFQHIYLVEAPTLEAATLQVMDETKQPDYVQKHLGEVVVARDRIEDHCTWTTWIARKQKEGYF